MGFEQNKLVAIAMRKRFEQNEVVHVIRMIRQVTNFLQNGFYKSIMFYNVAVKLKKKINKAHSHIPLYV